MLKIDFFISKYSIKIFFLLSKGKGDLFKQFLFYYERDPCRKGIEIIDSIVFSNKTSITVIKRQYI